MEAQQQGQSRGALVVCLLVLLLLMAVGWAILIVRVPILFTSQALPGFLLDRDSGIATLTHSNQDLNHPWPEEIRFNFWVVFTFWTTACYPQNKQRTRRRTKPAAQLSFADLSVERRTYDTRPR